MLAEFGGGHPGVMPEKVAEIKFAGKAQLAGDILDREPLVREQQARLVQPRALDVLVHGALPRFLKGGAQAGIAHFADGGEFLGLPVAERIGSDGVQNADDGARQFGVWRIQKIARHEQFAEKIGDDHMHLPFPASRPATDQPEEFALHPADDLEIVYDEFRIFLVVNRLVPEFQSGPAETKAHDGEMPPGRGDVGARLAHVHEPDFFATLKLETAGFVFEFPFAGLHPEKMRTGLLKTFVAVGLRDAARADGLK